MMEDQKSVKLDIRDDHIAVVTLNRPAAMNAVNSVVAAELEQIVDRLEADDSVWVVVITGEGGKVFCAGADLKEVSQGKLDGLISPRYGFAGFVQANRSKPWIAAVEGLALAGGCEIALACDMIVASQSGAFGLPEVTRGLLASAGGVYRLPRAIPPAIAKEIILTAQRLPSVRAAEFGMVNRLASDGAALEVAIGLAQEVAANAPVAVRESLAIARIAQDHDNATLHRLSLEAQARIMQTEDFQEGPRAFVEKRAPSWVGR